MNVMSQVRSSQPEVFLGKYVLKICSKFTGEHPCKSAISVKLLCNFIEIALCRWCSPASLLHIFRRPFLKNTCGWLLLSSVCVVVVTARRMSKYGVFSGPYFHAFGLNTGKKGPEKNSVFGNLFTQCVLSKTGIFSSISFGNF